jgi:DNA polymerase III subunit gamma/tau
VSLALYRTYRPGSVAEVIGQEHVTVPLARAIDSGRAHHAYLFTGPRGCGKTSTARIFARSLNCEQGPTSTPCGTCRQCIELAPNGPGSLDVIELDAASHRGIDEARDLRERAAFAPAGSRYKVYIIDEAHQLTDAAAQSLLKLIEEPPPHLRFVFATTEPDKILQTIKSRTHHYPFRLVPQRRLQEHLAWVCEREGVSAEAAALGLVARAGAGSVRDAMSVLGQVIAGAGEAGVTYADVVAQLGVTDQGLLDGMVDAIIAGDGAAMFSLVDRIVEGGLEPRRFATDLLERLRDLVVLTHVPEAFESGLLASPEAARAAISAQADALGAARASRAADLVSSGISELKGATAPRLQLELLCARLLLPGADDSFTGVLSRLDALERRAAGMSAPTAPAVSTGRGSATAAPVPAQAPEGGATEPPANAPAVAGSTAASTKDAPTKDGSSKDAPSKDAPTKDVPTKAPRAGRTPPPPPPLSSVTSRPVPASTPDAEVTPAAETGQAAQAAQGATAAVDITGIKSMWPAVLEALKAASRVAWTAFEQSSPVSVADGMLAVAMPDNGRITFARNGGHDERLRQALIDVLRIDVRPELMLDPERAGVSAPSPSSKSTGSVRADVHTDPAGASADDETVTSRSGVNLVTDILGGTVIETRENGV